MSGVRITRVEPRCAPAKRTDPSTRRDARAWAATTRVRRNAARSGPARAISADDLKAGLMNASWEQFSSEGCGRSPSAPQLPPHAPRAAPPARPCLPRKSRMRLCLPHPLLRRRRRHSRRPTPSPPRLFPLLRRRRRHSRPPLPQPSRTRRLSTRACSTTGASSRFARRSRCTRVSLRYRDSRRSGRTHRCARLAPSNPGGRDGERTAGPLLPRTHRLLRPSPRPRSGSA